MKSLYRKVESFDGQTITIDGKPSYELGSFLGGGAAGVVYEVRVSIAIFLPCLWKLKYSAFFFSMLAPRWTRLLSCRRCTSSPLTEVLRGSLPSASYCSECRST